MDFINKQEFYKNFLSIPDLEEETENILILEAQNGNKEAKNKVLLHNFKVIIEAIKPCKCNYRYDEDDLFQESIIGMTRAIESYKPEKKLKFKYYSLYYIKKYISQYINNNKLSIKVPGYIQMLYKKIKKIEHQYLLENNYDYPSIKYYSQELNIPEHVIERCIRTLEKTTTSNYIEVEDADET
ncbi:MAG: sigma factor [Vampirovibrionia bacterium]